MIYLTRLCPLRGGCLNKGLAAHKSASLHLRNSYPYAIIISMLLFHEEACLVCGKAISAKMKLIAESRGTPARFCSPAHRNAWNVKNSRLRSKAASVSLKATHKGNFKDHFGFDVECYVLDDEAKTAVISQRGMGETLGLGSSGTRLPRFLEGRRISKHLGAEIVKKAANPLVFQDFSAGAESSRPGVTHGYDVTLLIDICRAIVVAEAAGSLHPQQARVAQQAHIILSASAKQGIKDLVYSLAGYDLTKEEIIASFKQYVAEAAREYEKEFPDELYQEWYRLYDLQPPARNKPWKFKHLTIAQVYEPLAKSNGKVLELMRAQKARGNQHNSKLHQFLSEIGVKALRRHLGQLLGIAQVSESETQYEQHIEKVFGNALPLPLD